MEAYHTNMLTWHKELSHVVDYPLFDACPDGERRVETILNLIWLDELRGNAGRPRAHNPLASCQPDPSPAPSDPKACAYCLGDHKTSQHPADKPITQPCSKCRMPHALVGNLATPCPADPSTDP
eukprot:jgi/Tetstr1/429699/TSEL_019594.t1